MTWCSRTAEGILTGPAEQQMRQGRNGATPQGMAAGMPDSHRGILTTPGHTWLVLIMGGVDVRVARDQYFTFTYFL